jgi:hypothetical protein
LFAGIVISELILRRLGLAKRRQGARAPIAVMRKAVNIQGGPAAFNTAFGRVVKAM